VLGKQIAAMLGMNTNLPRYFWTSEGWYYKLRETDCPKVQSKRVWKTDDGCIVGPFRTKGYMFEWVYGFFAFNRAQRIPLDVIPDEYAIRLDKRARIRRYGKGLVILSERDPKLPR